MALGKNMKLNKDKLISKPETEEVTPIPAAEKEGAIEPNPGEAAVPAPSPAGCRRAPAASRRK